MTFRNYLSLVLLFGLGLCKNPFFPIYFDGREAEFDLRNCHKTPEVAFHHVQSCPKHSFILLAQNCSRWCCNRTHFPDHPIVMEAPTTLRKCSKDIYADENKLTIYEGGLDTNIYPTFQFLACLSSEFMESLRRSGQLTPIKDKNELVSGSQFKSNSLVSLYVDESGTYTSILALNSSLRTWDLRGDCQREWRPKLGVDVATSNVNKVDGGKAIHCQYTGNCVMPNLTSSSEEDLELSVDQIFRAKSFCLHFSEAVLDESLLEELNKTYADKYQCVEECRGRPRVIMALVNAKKCICVKYHALRPTFPVNVTCSRRCSDNEDELCGNDDEPDFFSAYSLFSTSFSYVMMLNKEPIRHPPSTVLPSEAFEEYRGPCIIHCVNWCKRDGFDVAIADKMIKSSPFIRCFCLLSKFYRFQMSDLTFSSKATHWCTGLNAPCPPISRDHEHYGDAAVFCNREHEDNNCDGLINFGYDNQACTEGQMLSGRLLGDDTGKKYWLCSKDLSDGRNKWVSKSCEHGYFHEEEGKCTGGLTTTTESLATRSTTVTSTTTELTKTTTGTSSTTDHDITKTTTAISTTNRLTKTTKGTSMPTKTTTETSMTTDLIKISTSTMNGLTITTTGTSITDESTITTIRTSEITEFAMTTPDTSKTTDTSNTYSSSSKTTKFTDESSQTDASAVTELIILTPASMPTENTATYETPEVVTGMTGTTSSITSNFTEDPYATYEPFTMPPGNTATYETPGMITGMTGTTSNITSNSTEDPYATYEPFTMPPGNTATYETPGMITGVTGTTSNITSNSTEDPYATYEPFTMPPGNTATYETPGMITGVTGPTSNTTSNSTEAPSNSTGGPDTTSNVTRPESATVTTIWKTTIKPKDCSEMDSSGTRWNCSANTVCKKNCFDCQDLDTSEEDCKKKATWKCDGSTGQFTTPDPDRSRCIQKPSAQPKKHCCQTDFRGTKWSCRADAVCRKSCFNATSDENCSYSGNDSGDDKMAYWHCNGNTGRFSTTQPDRSLCVEHWVDVIVNNITSGSATSTVLANDLLKKLEDNEPVSGGGLRKLTESLLPLIERRGNEIIYYDGRDNFTLSFISSVDHLLASTVSWQELGQDDKRYGSASLCLHSLTEAGRMHLIKQDGNQLVTMINEPPYNLDVVTITWETCVPFMYKFALEEESITVKFDQNCLSVISSAVRPDLVSTNMFPNKVNFQNMSSIHNTLLEISLFFEEDQYAFDPDVNVTIIFDHDHKAAPPSCVFWNPEELMWSDEGCVLDKRESNFEQKVICRCNHLTSFGVLFGSPYFGMASLTITTRVALTMSSFSLVATIVVLHFFHETESLRHMVGMNRNYCLLLANLVFFGLLDASERFGRTLCTVASMLAHFLWLSVFAWTALEGLVLYHKLVLVFERSSDHVKAHCLIGYGLPFLISLATFAVSYILKMEYLDDHLCWLNDPFLWAFKAPVALVCTCNLFIVTSILIVIVKFKKRHSDENGGGSNRQWIRNFALLVYLLGLGWLLGFLVKVHVVVEHMFVIVNGLLGIGIFVQGILLNQTVKDKLIKHSKIYWHYDNDKVVQFFKGFRLQHKTE